VTVFVSTHQLSLAEEMADRIGIIHQGRIIAIGTREELRQQSGAEGPLEQTFLALTSQEANHLEETKVLSGKT
jgi:ABC-2 type transport system ATP-binding protein